MREHVLSSEPHVPKAPFAVHQRLVGKVRRSGSPALSARHDGFGPYRWSELDRGDKAIADRAVNSLRAARFGGVERCQRAPLRWRQTHRQTRLGVIERGHDVVGEALKAIDFAPR